jgi:hypothetical protein
MFMAADIVVKGIMASLAFASTDRHERSAGGRQSVQHPTPAFAAIEIHVR